ncbi:LytR/AlgR family response regulator transcription factor [Paludibaculum fermentans]|uniref:LytTR family transcriptional regulator DNA-binding domain-containing protein n=1 Tax=Paludibaculum fermentans TaxID=1473598 RepID=A0A7S7NRM5_PALFE|nr:LytTR family transcriptional regulator DNA-binding domain-containing protein [Paludibaculum fermentans]QOY88512.1 LytTR family transcriptional regulator DNA-binding domain-containing protein [Paludibaculum fermentans]
MRILVVDDEPLAREIVIRHLAAETDVEVAGEAANGLEALEQIAALEPDAVFLDIEMPGLNGFEVVASLARPPWIVFVTAFDEYAIQAFEAHAVDYLLKPVQAERVARCVARLRTFVGRAEGVPNEVLRQLIREVRPAGPRRIAVKQGNRIALVSPREIIHISAEEKQVFVQTARQRYSVDKTVTELEECLDGSGFFRINRGDLVNLEHVRELMPWFSGAWRVVMSNGTELDVSRDRARHLKRELQL